MLSAAIQAGANPAFLSSSLHPPTYKPSSIFTFPKPCLKKHSSTLLLNRTIGQARNRRFSALAAAEAVETTLPSDEVIAEGEAESVPEKINEVVVNPVGKPRLVLKFIWMEKNIGLGLDQEIPGHGTVPLGPYFFWPRKDAWEELKTTLESKPWISQKKMIILLNQATDIINLWQQSGGNLTA